MSMERVQPVTEVQIHFICVNETDLFLRVIIIWPLEASKNIK